MAGVAIITEACIGEKDRACVDECPVQCIYEFDPVGNMLVSEVEAGSGEIETIHTPDTGAVAIFGDSLLYVNLDECTSCAACYHTGHATIATSSSSTATSSPTDPRQSAEARTIKRNP